MLFEISEEQRVIKDSVKKFAEGRIAPSQEEDENNGIFRREIVAEMGKLGFFGCLIPNVTVGQRMAIYPLLS